MKILPKIINQLPIMEENKYNIDINLLLKGFLDYEEEIPDALYEEREKKGLIGSAIYYLESIKGAKFIQIEGFITKELFADGYPYYNWTGKISHDFFLMIANMNNSSYIAMQINLYGKDPRCYSYERKNNNSYADAFLLKFEDYQDFYDLVNEIITEEATFDIQVDGKTYLITPQLQSEILCVRYMEGNEYVDIPNICASNDEELIEEIRKYNDNKNIRNHDCEFQLIKV